MSGPGEEVRREYVAVLETSLQVEDESALSQAYELGRRALGEGAGVLDMVLLHRTAVDAVLASTPGIDVRRLMAVAADLLRELCSPYEMAFRGYRDAYEALRHLNETLRQQKEAMEIANQELEAFSYSVSHDLRSPLRRIDGFSQILLEDFHEVLDDEGRQYLHQIREGAQRMAQLIDDLLALSRVKLTDIRRVDVNLTALAGDIAERLRAASPERRGRFIIQDNLLAHGDANLLAVLLENLLGNAWKFSSKREQAEVCVACELREGVPTYLVRDNGAGFDMAQAEKLFAAFQRLHSTAEFEGTGIGLAIVQRVVHRHGGRIWAEGWVEGGAAFYFTLGPAGAP